MEVIVGFVDEYRDEFGVESICTSLQVASSSYYAAKRRVIEPSARAVRDTMLMPILLALWVANRKVYGAQKLWKAAKRAGHDIGRDQVVRLMRELGIEGVTRQRKKVSPRAPIRTRGGHRISWTGTSPRAHRICSGSPISRTCRRDQAWPMCVSSSTRSPA